MDQKEGTNMKTKTEPHPQLREAIKMVSNKKTVSMLPKAFHRVVWELMKAIKRITKLEAKIMDKKMHKVTEKMKVAEKDVKKGAKKKAVKTLKKAEKANEKLVKIDRDVRDPIIEKYKKNMKKGKK